MQPLMAGRFDWTSCTAAADTIPVALARSVSSAALVVADDSTECNIDASSNISDDDLQLSSTNCRLSEQRSATPLSFSNNGYAAVSYFISTQAKS